MSLEETDGIRIDVEDARRRLEDGDAIALDVVQPGAWEGVSGVVKGAVRIPPAELVERFESLPRDKEIIAYCT